MANTNEIEYGIANRFLRIQGPTALFPARAMNSSHFAFLQKYYFDPTFEAPSGRERPIFSTH